MIFKILICLLISSAFAQVNDHDSLGVFYTDQRTSVVIGGQRAFRRLDTFFDAAKVGDNLYILSNDKSFEAKCFRNGVRASCTMIFTPSKIVRMGNRQLALRLPLNEISFPFDEGYEVNFQSANGDKMMIAVSGGHLNITATKKR